MVRMFLLGMAAFFVSQVCIRIPVLSQVLPEFSWFQILQFSPWGYGLFLGGTAALFEEGARWIAMRIYVHGKRSSGEKELQLGVAFGLGHGGIEAVLFYFIPAVAALAQICAGKAVAGVTLAGLGIGLLERVFAMSFHVGASLLIWYGVRREGTFPWFCLAVLLHTVTDAALVILPQAFGVGAFGLELWCAILGCFTLGGGIWIWKRKK